MRFVILVALLSQICICSSFSFRFPLFGVGGISSDSNKSITPIVTDGIIGQLYSDVANSSVEYLYEYKYVVSAGAVRIHVASENANRSYPLFSVVFQQRDVMSWQLPLAVPSETGLKEYNVSSHTLCPGENYLNYSPLTTAAKETVIVAITTSSIENVIFSLQLQQVSDFWIHIGEERQTLVSPSEPYYYQFKFPENVHTVLVKVTSDDDLCMMVSLQNITCPVFDSDSNVQYAGFWQTMYSKSGMTITREEFPVGFYIVFVVLPDDTQCTGSYQTISHPRTKNVTLSINEKITTNQYFAAIFGAIGLFFTIFITTVLISCYHFFRWRRLPIDVVEEDLQPIARCTPSCSYGSIPTTSQAQDIQNPNLTHADSDSSLDEIDYDVLEDADVEKEVFRSYTMLFVVDLARKSPRALAKKSQMYFWTIITISVFYALPVVQLVVTNQFVLQTSGNQDLCYYNFLCSHPVGFLSDFNHIYSNVGYVLLGLLFMFLTWRKDMMYRHMIRSDGRLERYCGIPQHFGLFYAMGAALVMEGMMSACYHVCPNHTNFQFDTSFMYIIAVMCMIKIYQSRHPDVNAGAYVAFGYLAFFIFMGVIGVLNGTEVFWIIFTVCHFALCITLTANIYYIGRWKPDLGIFKRVFRTIVNDCRYSPLQCIRPLYPDRMILLLLGNFLNWGLAIYGVMRQPPDFAFHLLSIFMVNLLYYTLFYIVMKLRHGERITMQPALYILLSVIFWAGAMYFFVHKCTTWELLPAQSRAYNRECILLGFYDNHDIWHFLSAGGMFFSFMILLTLDDDLTFTHRSKIHVF